MMAWIAYTVPAGLSVYWVMFNILGILQQLYVNYTHGNVKLAAGTGAVIQTGMEAKQEIEPEPEKAKKPEKQTEKKSSALIIRQGGTKEERVVMEVQSIEKKGRTVDEAIKAALDELGCDIDDVTIEILEEPSKGLLGLVAKSRQW